MYLQMCRNGNPLRDGILTEQGAVTCDTLLVLDHGNKTVGEKRVRAAWVNTGSVAMFIPAIPSVSCWAPLVSMGTSVEVIRGLTMWTNSDR